LSNFYLIPHTGKNENNGTKESGNMKKKNVVIAQSGGPTPVINNSLLGIIDTCKNYPNRFGTIYAGLNGIEGILKEELLNLSAQEEKEIKLLATTPAAGSIGTCRYKLKEKQK